MRCIICNSETEYYFSKDYSSTVFKDMTEGIGQFDYYKCPNCGFTFSRTHFEMSKERWERLNIDFHSYLSEHKKELGMPPYMEQALMLKVLHLNGIIDLNDALDYAGGDGTLSLILKKYFDTDLNIYDPYVHNTAAGNYIKKNKLNKYGTVLNSALFEHITGRKVFDDINNCVSDDGCMIINTIICENVPKDPHWFYLVPPVHCAFHTNKSMEILMQQWGYKASIYCPGAKSWILLKNDLGVKEKIKKINEELCAEYLIYKEGFVDYWKGF